MSVRRVTVNGAAATSSLQGAELVITPAAGIRRGTAMTVVVCSGLFFGACVFAASATLALACLLFLCLLAITSVAPLAFLDPTASAAYGHGRWLLAILLAVLAVLLNRLAADTLDGAERKVGQLSPPVVRP